MEFCACTATYWSYLDCGVSVYAQQWIKFPCLASGFYHHFVPASKCMLL